MSAARKLPPQFSGTTDALRLIAEAVNQTIDGRLAPTGTVTLTASAASTVVADRYAGTDSVPIFVPTTANAAAALATTYVSARGKQTFTLTHANNAQTDRTFIYFVVG